MKVLMSAYACEPNRGSEPGVGWNWALQAARFHEVWVLTRANNREVIESELARNSQPNLHFIYHDLPKWASWWKKGGRGIHLYYYLWQLAAIPVVREAHRKFGFDLTHHVTMVTHRFPSALAWLNAPFIWGPIAGAEKAPRAFFTSFDRSGRLEERLREASNRLVKWEPLVQFTSRRAWLIVSATEDTRLNVSKSQRRKSKVIPAIGISTQYQLGDQEIDRPKKDSTNILYVGNLLHWKGIHYAIRAVAALVAAGLDVHLTLVGSGSFESHLRGLTTELDLDDHVTFIGKVPHHQVAGWLRIAEIFVFPSLHDSGGFAVLEAMQAELPVVCLDLGGPGVIVTDETGIKVRAHNPDQVVNDLADALLRLHNDPDYARRLGQAGRERVEAEYSWDHKGEIIRNLYLSLAKQSTQ